VAWPRFDSEFHDDPLAAVKIRLQKFLAEAGIASRRASEEIIRAGRVTVNGQRVTELGSRVDPHADEVAVDRVPVKAKRKLYLLLNKPKGYICSRNDPERRPTVFELIPPDWRNLYPVGRLDYNTEGLIFLTNDGDFALRITHPRYEVAKKYLATVHGRVDAEILRRLTHGVFDEGEKLQADRARVLKTGAGSSLVEVVLREGKNREIRRLFETLGFPVEHLKRVQIGPIKLSELPVGRWRALTESEIKSLLGESGRKLQ